MTKDSITARNPQPYWRWIDLHICSQEQGKVHGTMVGPDHPNFHSWLAKNFEFIPDQIR